MYLNTNWGRDLNAILPFAFCVKQNNFKKSGVSPQSMQLHYKGYKA